MPIFSNFYLYSFSCLNSIGFDFDTFLILAAIEAKITVPTLTSRSLTNRLRGFLLLLLNYQVQSWKIISTTTNNSIKRVKHNFISIYILSTCNTTVTLKKIELWDDLILLSITAIFFRYYIYLSSAGCLYLCMWICLYDCSHTVQPAALKLLHNINHREKK